VAAARDSYRLNEERVRRAPEQGRPIELLQAIQALARARQDYVQLIADYNRAQFRLYTSLGNPPSCALESIKAIPIKEPVIPEKTPAAELAPPPKPLPDDKK
jgi:outer membrane protein TolC